MTVDKTPTLTVIIPVYNAADFIEKTVSTLLNVTRIPDEIILVNDGSADDSGRICDRLAGEHQSVIAIHQTNAGIANARNAGIEAATGDYICFVDQDDMPSEEMYEIGMGIVETPVDIVMFSTGRLVKGKKSDYEVFRDEFYDFDGVRNVLLPAFLYRGYEEPKRDSAVAVTASIWKCIIRRQFLVENHIRFKRFISYEDDYIMMMELLCSAKRIRTSSHRGYYWVINEGSESHSVKYIENYGKKLFELNEYLCDCLKEAGLSEEKVKVFSDQLLFEKTIDVIANAVKNQKSEIYEYIASCSFFDLDDAHIRPLPKFRRLKMLYNYKHLKNADALIGGVRLFLKIEGIIQQNPLAKILLRK